MLPETLIRCEYVAMWILATGAPRNPGRLMVSSPAGSGRRRVVNNQGDLADVDGLREPDFEGVCRQQIRALEIRVWHCLAEDNAQLERRWIVENRDGRLRNTAVAVDGDPKYIGLGRTHQDGLGLALRDRRLQRRGLPRGINPASVEDDTGGIVLNKRSKSRRPGIGGIRVRGIGRTRVLTRRTHCCEQYYEQEPTPD